MLQSSSCQQARCPTQAQEAEVEVEEKANSQHWRSGAIECCRGKERMPFMSYACICLHEDWYSKIKELFNVLWICFAFKKNLQTEKAKNEEMQKRVRGNTLAYGVEIQVYVHQGHTYAYSMLYITGMMHTCGIPKHSYYCVCVCIQANVPYTKLLDIIGWLSSGTALHELILVHTLFKETSLQDISTALQYSLCTVAQTVSCKGISQLIFNNSCVPSG